MHPFQIVMIISTTALLLVAALFLMIRKMPSRPGMEWWLGAALCQALAYFLGLLFFGNPEKSLAGDVIFYGLQMAVNLGLFVGTQLFIRKPINPVAWVQVLFCLFLVATGIRFAENLVLADLVFAMFNSACLLLAGLSLFSEKAISQDQVRLEKITAICFICISIHWLDYPFVKNLEWFVPIGFFLGMAFAVSIFLLLATLALLQFKEHTKKSEQKAIFAATHDPLTGLYNRGYMGRLFERYALETKRAGHAFVVLYIDLDGFKEVNDTYGHKAGDAVLTILSKRLHKWLGKRGDALRLGGDEILVFSTLRGRCQQESVEVLAEKILSLIEDPMVDGDNRFCISASIGVCCYPLHGDSLDQIVGIADDLMYQAKNAGKGTIRYAGYPLPETSFNDSLDSIYLSHK
ncbi:MAG: GGDEF domain-containing protein [Thiolinea sp.]